MTSIFQRPSFKLAVDDATNKWPDETVLRRRRTSPHTKSTSMLSSIRQIEYGGSIPERFSWQCQLSNLSYLKIRKPGLNPTHFNGPHQGSQGRHSHVAHLSTSSDGALLSVAGNYGRIEIHELGSNDTDTRRLSLVPWSNNRLELSACAWASYKENDFLLASFGNRSEVWQYNLQTCREDQPCRVYSMLRPDEQAVGSQTSVTDLISINNHTAAAATGTGFVKIIDVRIKGSRHSIVGSIETKMSYALIASQGHYLYSADTGNIALYDIRVSNVSTAGSLVKSFGKNGRARSKICTKSVARKGWFNFLQTLPESAPGCVAYQSYDGTVGYTDLATSESAGVQVSEIDPHAYTINGREGLNDLGTMEDMLHSAWYMKRRQCAIIKSSFTRGWTMLAPLLSRRGIRIIQMNSDTDSQVADLILDEYYSCVCAPDGTLDRLVLCDASNRVTVRQIDFDAKKHTKDKANS